MKKTFWSVNDIEDLSKKIIVVTGANSGIGFEAVKIFSAKNAIVIMACRSIERGNKAKEAIIKNNQNAILEVMELDLSKMSSIHYFSKKMHEKYPRVDILINNAGVMMVPYAKTSDGLEAQQGVNHFGHFLLTALLFDMLKNGKDARIVNVSSLAHKAATIDFDNLLYDNGKKYNPAKAYARSKLENLLFTYCLADKVEKENHSIKVLAAHPGVSHTNLGRHINTTLFYKIWNYTLKYFSQEAKDGCLPIVKAATSEDAKNGDYYGPNGFLQLKGVPVKVKSTKKSHQKDLQQKLWEVSELRTNTKFL